MTDLTPFLDHAEVQRKAELIAEQVNNVDCLLLWKAYVKRIQPVPIDVLLHVSTELSLWAGFAGVVFDSMDERLLVADMVGDAFWNRLDEQQRYAWLLKVKS
jgi:hypothetical protein